MKLKVGQHIHLVGIGGSGLSAIARILLGQGYKVSGSDRSLNSLTEGLARDGATIYQGHDAGNIKGADALIITSAVKSDHVEVVAALEQGIPVYKRQDIIADLMEGKTVIAVAGTHGKTTTTSMIVHVLRECGKDPSYIVGGIMGNTGTNAGVGKGDIFVIEADEYDNMFHGLKPNVAVITSIEYDHPDFFKSEREVYESFLRFIKSALQGAVVGELNSKFSSRSVILCTDSPLTKQIAYDLLESRTPFFTTYSIDNPDDKSFRAENIHVDLKGRTGFDLITPKGVSPGICLSIPGKHNVLNALATLIVADTENIPFTNASAALQSFKPAGRRFDVRADVNEIAVIDDYAHHPTAIRVTLEAARQRYPERTIWAVWQPHTFSRTQALMSDTIKAFDSADHVLITDIYAARENPIEGVTSAAVVKAMNHADARHTATFEDTVKVLREEVESPAVILIMSAGDAPQIGIEYLKGSS